MLPTIAYRVMTAVVSFLSFLIEMLTPAAVIADKRAAVIPSRTCLNVLVEGPIVKAGWLMEIIPTRQATQERVSERNQLSFEYIRFNSAVHKGAADGQIDRLMRAW